MLCSDPLCQSCTSSWEAPVTVSHHRGRTLTLWEGCGHWHISKLVTDCSPQHKRATQSSWVSLL